MGIQHSQQSAFVKEMQKWESRPVMIGDTMIMPIPIEHGGRLNAPFAEYPKMLVKMIAEAGGYRVNETTIVNDESAERMKLADGWSLTQQDGIARAKAWHTEIATLAANRAFHDARMSPRAQAEAAALDEQHAEHLPAIPETPIRRRQKPSRKPKLQTAAAVHEG